MAVRYDPRRKKLVSIWERETIDPRERTVEHAIDRYTSGQIDASQFELDVDLAIRDPDAYRTRFGMPPPPPPLPPPSAVARMREVR